MKELKIKCGNCGQHFAFPDWMCGEVINCPNCGLSVALNLPGFSNQNQQGKTRTVFYYVFWGVMSLIATSIIIWLVIIFFPAGAVAVDTAVSAKKKIAQQANQTFISAPSKNILQNEKLKALIAAGEFIVSTNDFNDSITVVSKCVLENQNGLFSGIGVSKSEQPTFILMAIESTPIRSNELPLGGFDTVKCKVGQKVFELKQSWKPSSVQNSGSGTFQRLFWNINTDESAKNCFLQFGDCENSSSVKVQFSSSFMGGSREFNLAQAQLESIKKLVAVYREFNQ